MRSDSRSIEHVARGQRLVIISIIVNLAAMLSFQALWRSSAFGIEPLYLALLISIPGLVLSIVGILRLTLGLGYLLGSRVLLVVLSLVPLINLLVLVRLNARATRALRAAGYRVGLLGARKDSSQR